MLQKNLIPVIYDFASAILRNKKFAGAKINKKDAGVDYTRWETATTNLYESAYAIASERYNAPDDIDYTKVFESLKALYLLVGTLENGATLRADKNAVDTIIGFAGGMKGCKSPIMEMLSKQRSDYKKQLQKALDTNGTPKKTITTLNNKLKGIEAEMEKEKLKEWATWKDFRPVTYSTFAKNVEVFMADMITKRKAMTADDLQAEKEARRAAKKAAKKVRKSSKKASK